MGTIDDLHNTTWRLFLLAQSRVIRQIQQRLSAANLPPLEWYDVLWALKQAPEQRLRLSDLADQLLLSRSNLTRLLDRLEKQDLLQREPCSSDRRGTFAVLTASGAAMQQTMWSVYADCIAYYFGDPLEDEEVALLQHAFHKILDTLPLEP